MDQIVKKELVLEDVSIHYIEKNESSSQTMLCLHALGHSSRDYENIFKSDEFSDYRIIAIDFPGHGGSSAGTEAVSSSYYAEVTKNFINALGLKGITILGNSIGGAVAIRVASADDIDVTSMQLANPAGLDKGGVLSKIFLSFMVWFFEKGVKKHPKFQKWFSYYYSKVLPSDEAVNRRNEIINEAYSIAPVLAEGWKSFKLPSEDLKPVAASLKCPVLVTWAMKDKKVQYARNIKAVKNIKQLSLIKYTIGHTPVLENSKEFIMDLKKFINRHNTGCLQPGV